MKYFVPFSVVALFGLSTHAAVDFKKDIAPIIEKTCIECHGEQKQKGDLRLDNKEGALKGGKAGPAIVAGDAEKSDLIKRISLPKGHDDVMPPKGDPLAKEQIEAIKAWIADGAKWPDGFALKSSAPAEGTHAAAAEPVKLPEYKPGAAENKAVAALEAAGVSIRPIAQNVNWKEASFRSLGTNATDASVAPLKDVLGLMDLNLAGTKITDAGLASIKGLTNLITLHLEHTKITDAGLVHLKNLNNLVYLNLFNTGVTDAGLANLEGMSKLKNLYIWQTKVTDDGIKKLQAKLPNVHVQKGWEVTAAAKPEEKPAEKK
jgi:hypothetical protein